MRVKVFHPHYYGKFACIGDKCRDNCCRDWEIEIDRASYDKYMSVGGELGDELKKNIIVVAEEPFYARLKLDENGTCPFVTDKGLCRLQLTQGYDFLCIICRIYPRKFSNIAGEAEAFLSMSCSAAAKLALSDKNIMRFSESEIELDDKMIYYDVLDTDHYTTCVDAVDLFWKLRTSSILILQSRQYALWLRMVILGLFIKQADELMAEKRHDDIFSLCDEFTKRLESGFYNTLGDKLPDRYDLKSGYLLHIIKGIKKHRAVSSYTELAMKGLEIGSGELDFDAFAERFVSVKQKYYQPFMRKNEHILENYIVNLLFSEGFPFNYELEKNMLQNYFKLAAKYSFIKFILIGISGYYNFKFDKRVVIDCVSHFSKTFDHNKKLVNSVIKYLEDNNANSVGTLSMLMKD